jgi:transcriptional regulator with XRE-family HTH domain
LHYLCRAFSILDLKLPRQVLPSQRPLIKRLDKRGRVLYFIYNNDEEKGSHMKARPLFGVYFKQKRIEKGYTLREFCRRFDLDPGNISKLERGMLPPPDSKEKMEEYATYLNIKRGTDDWYQFFDLAAASKGIIPREFLADDELMRSLPIIFRTFRSKKVSKKAVEDLVERLKKT